MFDQEKNRDLTDDELMKEGMGCLDDSLAYFMELKDTNAEIMAHLVYSALRLGEALIEDDFSDLSMYKDVKDNDIMKGVL